MVLEPVRCASGDCCPETYGWSSDSNGGGSDTLSDRDGELWFAKYFLS